jgi:secondary thiamine-phosphate synthase enzyme
VHAQQTVVIGTRGQGLYEFTDQAKVFVEQARAQIGTCTLFVQHTSASLTIQENADPSVQRDLASFLARLVPEGDPGYTHTDEGPDDMPAHIKGALTSTSLTIPIVAGRLALGTWQGVFLWEHRTRPHQRKVVIHLNVD